MTGEASSRVGPYKGPDLSHVLRDARAAVRSGQTGTPKTPGDIALIYERGRTGMAVGHYRQAFRIMRNVTRLAPDHANAWRDYAVLLRYAARDVEATEAEARAATVPADAWPLARGEQDPAELRRRDEELQEQLAAIAEGQRAGWLRERLAENPLDTAALRYLADEENSTGDTIKAGALLLRALELSPAYLGARAAYAGVLAERRDHMAAYHECAHLMAAAPDDFEYRLLRADCAMNIERFDEAKTLYEQLLQERPRHLGVLRSYGLLMKTLGNRDEAARTFRTLLSHYPNAGIAYYGLNELRANYLDRDDVAQMTKRLAAGVRIDASRRAMAYALAQTLEGMGEYKASFDAYQFAARESRAIVEGTHQAHDPAAFAERLDRMRRTFSVDAIAARAGIPPANPATTPIFVMGMVRAGSTLVEQILASHDQVEGTRELPVVSEVIRGIALSRRLVAPDVYPDRVLDYSRGELDRLGAEVLAGIAKFRRSTLPYVIDKRPWNWVDAPFLHLILPQAKFIDVRRAPMAACFAMFKQMLPVDAAFTYDLTHLGRYYRDYVKYMDYLDTVMPGAILRVSYETLVDNTEPEIRRMLDYCGLPFREACLRFWETDRAVLTPSAEQVRKPIYRGALDQWKNFEPWLGELKESLGDPGVKADAPTRPSTTSGEKSTTRTSFGTASHVERPPDAPSPVLATLPSQLYELALTLAAMGFHGEATRILRDVTVSAPGHAPAWEKLAALLRLAGKDNEASDATSRSVNGAALWPAASDSRTPAEIVAAERALLERVGALETLPERLKALRDHLRSHEIDAAALRVLGRLQQQNGNATIARALFERALVLVPDYDNARADLAILLLAMDENGRALAETSQLIARAPANMEFRAIHANALCAVGDFEAAIPTIELVMRAKPSDARARRVYARSLYIAGRRDDSAREYRACLALEPGMAEVYAGLADLRGGYLTATDTAAMRKLLCDGNLDLEGRRTIQYALGYALELAQDFSGSAAAYEAGAALSQTVAANSDRTYYPAKVAHELNRRRAVFAAPLLARDAPAEGPLQTPIFVVGMPRAGSTLVEQILASHSLVEGTMELPVLGNMVWDLSHRRLISNPDAYPECVRDLTASELADLGAHYLEESKVYRRTNRPYFIDKQPWNWWEVGLIRLILPHAKIVDVRRKPMAACFAMYKLQLEIGALFPYGFRNLAHYYTQYAGMMTHYEAAMPGYVHFLSYERLVEDTESEIRCLLAYCGLPFEENCVRFWETGRAVATPSGEQVRKPIYRDAVEQWRNFESWLGPLKQALQEAETATAAAPQPQA